jgi:gluconokinase
MSTRFPRSIYDKTGGLVYFARLLDKIRLHAAHTLPAAYHENLGGGFDGRCCDFLGVKYPALRERVLAGGTDDEVLHWCFEHGRKRSADEITDWNEFMWKRGWRDSATPRLHTRLKESKLEGHQPPILTFFDYIEVDEGRTPPTLS